jgi:hypothetical protein
MKLAQVYKDAPPIGKIAIIGAGIATAAIAWFAILNPVRKLIVGKLDQAKANKEGGEAKDELKNLSNDGINPTINDAQVQSMCNALVSAFEGCGTDEDAVYNVMRQLKNDADVYKLINAYGTRKYDACGFWGSDTEKTLSGAISDELDVFEKKTVNGILSSNGIKYQFS